MTQSNVHEHSKEAYNKIKDKRESHAERIYMYLMQNPDSTDLDISKGTGITINAVQAPRARLIHNRRVYSARDKVNEQTGMTAKAWRVKEIEGHGAFNKQEKLETTDCPFCVGNGKPTSSCGWCDGKGKVNIRRKL